MSSFSNKIYAKFFGENLREDVFGLMPELQNDTPSVVENFLEHLCSPTIHPLHMPTGKEGIYERAELTAPMLFEDITVSQQQLIELEALYNLDLLDEADQLFNITKKAPEKKERNLVKIAADSERLKGIKDKGVKILNRHRKGKHAFRHMKAGFHKAFNVNPDTGEEGPEDDEKTHQAKVQTSYKHFNQFLHRRGGMSATGKNKMFTSNGKTESSKDAPLKDNAGKSYKGVKTVGLSLSPANASGYHHNLCPKATGECTGACLGTHAGGNKQFPYTTARAKLLRTQYIHEHPEHAARIMHHELTHNEKCSKDTGYKAGACLNVTSDIPYEHLMPKKFFDKHKDTQFYDYTKVHGRLKNKKLPSNYHLSLSHTGTNHPESNDKEAIEHLKSGGVVAMVHQRLKKGQTPPHHVRDRATGQSWETRIGDKNDNTFEHVKERKAKQGVVRTLKLKGVNAKTAGHFANRVDKNGVIWIGKHSSGGPHPEEQY